VVLTTDPHKLPQSMSIFTYASLENRGQFRSSRRKVGNV
jgi:hypothetical protein